MKKLIPAAVAILVALACGNDHLVKNTEPIEVVEGQPSVGQTLPGVLRDNPDAGVVIGGAAPFQVDSFVQPKVSKVDILWVIDDSPSMTPKQQRVKDNFVSFMQFLSDQQIDYHLGVVTTDTYNPAESGKLQNTAALAKPWIDLADSSDGGTAAASFVTNASVGTGGSGDEKGLLGGMMALTAPLDVSGGANCTASGECFLRPDAQLYTIIVSDEEDSSCSPIRSSSEGCDDGAAATTGYGSIGYWSRFYAGIKGPAGVSRLAAITGVDNTFQQCSQIFAGICDSSVNSVCGGGPDCSQFGNLAHPCCKALTACQTTVGDKAQWCAVHQLNVGGASPPFYKVTGLGGFNDDTGGFNGCVSKTDAGVIDFSAYYAPRYATVAQATGGIATSICNQDYTPALQSLGLQASGLRSDFPLSRAPVDGTIVLTVNGAKVASSASTWQYVKCSGSTVVNSIHFVSKAALPPASATVTASYDVNVRGLTCP